MQIISFILVILPVLYIMSIFQKKSKNKVNKKNYKILMLLSIVGVVLSSILMTIVSKEDHLSFMLVIASIGAGIIWGIIVSIVLFFLSKLLNK
nr:hypothetical protein [Mammaliicoccus sp. Marseille-Q6498]